jgi:hypothetical protein
MKSTETERVLKMYCPCQNSPCCLLLLLLLTYKNIVGPPEGGQAQISLELQLTLDRTCSNYLIILFLNWIFYQILQFSDYIFLA